MTERLYYTDAYLREFDAVVERVHPDGGRVLVWLNRTAFYPASGGQPADLGALAGAPVLDVFDDERGDVVHAVSGASLGAGVEVHGAIDWPRRFDHMQQHSGQHVLSAAFEQVCAASTVSFHLGAELSTIDVSREVGPDQIAAAESEANRIVWEDRPVTIKFVDAAHAATLPLRKEPARAGRLRLVEVDSWDLSACGGTHVARTGAIGTIVVTAWERFKGGHRIQFAAGRRALGRYRALRDAVAGSVRALSVLPDNLPAAIERLQGEAREHKRTVATLEGELAGYRAQQLVVRAINTTHGKLIAEVIEGDAAALKPLASALIAQPGYVVVLATAAAPSLLVVARSADVALPANALVAQVAAQFSGKGGGRPDFAQAGGLAAPGAHVVQAAAALLNRAAM